MEKQNFPSLLVNRPTQSSVPEYNPIYEWEYIDEETGEIIKESKNIQEEINSYERQTRFKEKIERGEKIEDGRSIYMDISELGDNPSDISKYLKRLSDDFNKIISESNAIAENAKIAIKSGKIEAEGSEITRREETKGEKINE